MAVASEWTIGYFSTDEDVSVMTSGGWETLLYYPSGWTTGQVLTKTASGYDWAAPTGWIAVDPNSPIQLTKIWAWTQAQYEALWTYDNTTVYLTI
jgi:hypothetical protein